MSLQFSFIGAENHRCDVSYGELTTARKKLERFVGVGIEKKSPFAPTSGRFGSVAHCVRLDEDWSRSGISPAR